MRTVNELFCDTSAKAYVQHGFIPEKENNSQIIGVCPFCDKKDHFYVSKGSKKWDCKYCGLSGGYKTFLRKVITKCKKAFGGDVAISLKKDRGIKNKTILYFNVGYNVITGKYCFPVYFGDGKLIDIRIYDGKKIISTFGCQVGLFGLGFTKEKYSTIYLCEGEWDAMVMHQIIQEMKFTDCISLGVPGAGVFKGDWQLYFRNKNVICIYDNDEAGIKGSIKVFNLLKSVSCSLKFVRWHTSASKGFDLNDLFKDKGLNHKKTFNYIMKHLHDFPQSFDESEYGDTNDRKYTGYEKVEPAIHNFEFIDNGLLPNEVYKGYKKYLHLPNTDCIDYMYTVIIANRMDGIPVWSFIVAPSGFIKTTFITSISGAQDIHEEDNMSSAGLVSGYTQGDGGNSKKKKMEKDSSIDNSLLPELNGMTLIIQDLTSLLSDREDNKRKTFGIFRSCFDGKYKHRFGNVKRIYESTFGMLAGVTPAGVVLFEDEGALGERFISFEMTLPEDAKDEIEYIRRAMDNTSMEKKIKESLIEIGTKTLDYDYIKYFPEIYISEKMYNKIAYLSLFVSIMRGKVEYDKYSQQITHKAQREIATRLSKQMVKMLKGLCMFKRKKRATMMEYDLLKKIAISTVPNKRNDLLYSMYKTSVDGAYSPQIMSALDNVRLSYVVCDINARKMSMLDILDMHPRSKGSDRNEFTINEKFLDIIRKSRIY